MEIEIGGEKENDLNDSERAKPRNEIRICDINVNRIYEGIIIECVRRGTMKSIKGNAAAVANEHNWVRMYD